MDKKKYVNSYYIVLLGVLFAIFFGLFSNSYAITNEEFDYYLEYIKNNYPENNDTTTYMANWFNTYTITDIRDAIKNKVDFTNYNFFTLEVFKSGNSAYTLFSFFDTTDGKAVYKSGNNTMVLQISNNTNRLGYQTSNLTIEPLRRFSSATSNYNMFASLNQSIRICFAFPTIDFYANYEDTTPTSFYSLTGKELITTTYNTSSITLETPLTSFHRYQGIGDTSQLQVTITGDYNIEDFSFYIQQLNNDTWSDYTDINDYYLLYDNENEELYNNPYYVFWHNISYLPIGTYRFIAKNSISEIVANTNSFTVTDWVINSTGTADGTIDSNGNVNIDVTIDNGNTVTEILDELEKEPEDPNKDIENSVKEIQENLEQEMNDNQIIGALQEAEQGFLDLLKEPEKDFKISWNDIYYQGVVLIPASQINFSQLCRENQTLQQVRHYINIILSFTIAIGIIKYLYNLILSTLGIDNNLLYEKPEETTTFTADTSTGTVTYRTRTKEGNTIIHKGKMKGRENKG